MFGLLPDARMSYERFLQAVHPDDREHVDQAVKTAVEKHELYNVEMRALWPDGTLHWINSRGCAYYNESGQPVRMSGTALDITERKRAEEALVRSEKLASVGRLAATIAHEVNNPLAAATNALYLAASDPSLSAATRDHLKLADQELRRAAHVATRTLSFCRESAARAPLNLPKLVNEVLGVYARKLQERGIGVRQRYRCGPCGEDCDSCFVGNAGELRQVISNLLGNGIDALRDNGTLQVRVSRISGFNQGPPRIRLTIADNGCGIRASNLKRIFEPFFTTKQAVGTGLGLWTTREIIGKYGGSVRVRSQPGRGTVFSVLLPAISTEAPAKYAERDTPGIGGNNRSKECA